MRRAGCVIALSILGIAVANGPALAWDQDFLGVFHRYGDDMYQPAITPERPYWHGDDAVPPSLRWHDREVEIVDDFGFTVATRLPTPEPVVPVVVAAPRPVIPRRHHAARHAPLHRSSARAACPPSRPYVAGAAPLPVIDRPPVPAETEH